MEQVRKPPERDSQLRLAALEVRLLEWLILHDVAALDRRVGAEFTLTTGRPGAEVRSRADWLRVAAGEYVLESFAVDEVATQTYGDVAVVRMRYQQIARMGDKDRTGAYRMTDVFVRRDGDWVLVARHASQVPGQPDTGRAAATQPAGAGQEPVHHSSSSLAQPQPQP